MIWIFNLREKFDSFLGSKLKFHGSFKREILRVNVVKDQAGYYQNWKQKISNNMKEFEIDK